MSMETQSADDGASETLEGMGRELGAAIASSPVHERFVEAQAAVEDDDEAQALISEFEQERQAFTLARQNGSATQEDLRELQATQEELHSLPVMEEFLESKAELQGRLEAVNEAISEQLEVDFGGEAGGCCQDD
ncbi:YlbF family regulator [Halobium salinum]|uniref:YlbF family regulator n=1 Tax=Halobium salinum TaxID=1364940 RepID=A0ABD5PDU9_9EURY|nr:YlbF family regulator [Halobium salinum]